MTTINISCKQCNKTYTAKRTKEIPNNVSALTCNWCPTCPENDYYNEEYVYFEEGEPKEPTIINPNQTELPL